MDEKIKNLEKTTFFGKRYTRKQLFEIQRTVELFPKLSRNELAQTICEHLGLRTYKGDNRYHSALLLLEHLEKLGVLRLPAKKEGYRRGAQQPIEWTWRTEARPEIAAGLDEVMPVKLLGVTDQAHIGEWNEWVDRYHYLGYRHPIGNSCRYFIVDQKDRKLGCMMFSFAVKSSPCRDEWIGWQDQPHKKHLQRVVNNNRFLIFPWVRVPNLASKVLSMASRQLPDDWRRLHGVRPVLIETFVDPKYFSASCYRAANWQQIGQTQPRVDKSVKDVYVHPLDESFRSILIDGRARRLKKRPRPPPPLSASDPLVQLWSGIVDILFEVSAEFDGRWQQRRRVLNSLLVMLFIFRLVFSHNRQGYRIVLLELWQQCRALEIDLPQPKPVAASAICNARGKLDEHIFKQLNRRVLQQAAAQLEQYRWQGHRLYAVDGSKLNLPRPLCQNGYRRPNDQAHYPQGLISCLYQLQSCIPFDFELTNHANEGRLAREHLQCLQQDDVVVYDRGYYSYGLLHRHRRAGVHAIFRMRRNTTELIDAFIKSDRTHDQITLVASRHLQRHWNSTIDGTMPAKQQLRLVKYTHGGTTFTLGTTLLDAKRYSIEELSQVYHARWGIEGLYAISKNLLSIEQFHAQTERGVKQELYAHFVLITLTRLFANHSEMDLNGQPNRLDQQQTRVNFKNALAVMARHLEQLLLQQSQLLTNTVNSIITNITACRCKERFNRSYERQSKQPRNKWQRKKKQTKALTA